MTGTPYRPEPCPKCAQLEQQLGALTEELTKLKNPAPQVPALPRQPWWRMFWRAPTPRLPQPSLAERIGRVWVVKNHTFMVFDGATYARRTSDWRAYALIAGEEWADVETGVLVENKNLKELLGRAIVHHANVGHAAERAANLQRLRKMNA